MILRQGILAERHVTFRANEVRIFLSTINLEIQRAAFIHVSRDMTAVSTATRSHGNLDRFWIDGAEACAVDLMTIQAA